MSPQDNRNKVLLDDDRIGRLLLQLTIPSFLGMFVNTMYNVVNTIFIGHYVGPMGIAGLSIVFPVQMLAVGIGQMTGMGGASLISRLIGAGNKSRAELALGNALISTIALSILVTIIGLSDVDRWLRFIGASETILPYARDYMTIILFGIVFQTGGMALNGLIRAEGNTRVPMIGMMLGAVLNIILCAIFIIVLGMGIRGSALAAVIAELFSFAYLISYYFGGKSFLKIRPSNLMFNLGILKEVMAVGAASFAQTIAGSFSSVLMNRMIVSYGGDYAISAYGIINRIMMFALMPGIVVGQGAQPIMGFNYGARRYDRLLKALKLALISSTIICVIAFMFLFFFPETLVRIFTTDIELINICTHASRRIWLAIYLMGFLMVGSTVFQALGKALQAFVTAIARPALFLVPSLFIMAHFWKLDGIWLSFPVTDTLTCILTLLLLLPQIKTFRRLSASMNTTGS